LARGGDEITKRLARRLSKILGETNNDRKNLMRRFKQLYSFRSDLVHGNKFNKEVYWGHLREAREFARSSVNWFLNLLADIKVKFPYELSEGQYPDRDVILSLIDMNEAQRSQTRTLINNLPAGFPYVKAWKT
jgi:hypothetical protein